MPYKIVVKASARKEIERLPVNVTEAIDKKITMLADNPRLIGSVKLSGFINLYRVRVMDYRIVYSIHDEIIVVEIIKIAHRKEIYKHL
ncbi:MAG: type II toxin-antitoxin system RelE/ParE family toxin [Bacteroidales bacterium]